MATRRYRIITAAALQRIPFDGIVDGIEHQRASLNGALYMVERADGYEVNHRWMSHSAALAVLDAGGWSDLNASDL